TVSRVEIRQPTRRQFSGYCRDCVAAAVLLSLEWRREEKTMKVKVWVRPESVGGYSVSVPAFPGCHSQGETFEEALANIREAAELWLEVSRKITCNDREKL